MRNAVEAVLLAHATAGLVGVFALLVGGLWLVKEALLERVACRMGVPYRRREWWA